MYLRQLLLEDKSLPRLDLASIACHVLRVPRERLFLEPERPFDEEEWRQVQELVEERRKGRPLAYITNRKEFFSEEFYVDEQVLIPRPETELLVEEGLSVIGEKGGPTRVLDVGCGSGIIGIMLARGGADKVLSIDRSPGAVSVARKNSSMLKVEDRISLAVSDLLSAISADAPAFDLVCANLPYVTEAEYEKLMDDVRCFEPREALVGGPDGMDLYRRLVRELEGRVAPGGAILCEIGGTAQASTLSALMRDAGLVVTVKNDLAGRQRMVKGVWTSS